MHTCAKPAPLSQKQPDKSNGTQLQIRPTSLRQSQRGRFRATGHTRSGCLSNVRRVVPKRQNVAAHLQRVRRKIERMIMNSDTPETDAEIQRQHSRGNTILSLSSFARKLERERDEVIKARNHNRVCVERLAVERDQLRKVCDELAQLLKQFDRQSAKLIFESYNQLPHVKEKNK